MRSGLVQVGIATFVLSLLALFPRAAIGGGTFTVTRLDDPSPNGCQANDCSFREAVIDANGNPGHDTINLPPGTILLELAGTGEDASATGDLDITDDTTVLGSGTEVDAHGIDRVFDIGPATSDDAITVDIRQLTIRGGSVAGNGGGIRAGASSGNTLILRDATVHSNMAEDGGGVYTCCGTGAEITNVVVRNNLASADGGGLFHCCGSSAPYTLTRAQIFDNAALEDGGGVFFCCGSTATLTDVNLTNNYAGDQGGGLFHCCNGTGLMTVSGATIDGNTAETEGGGFYSCCASTTVTGTNVTISGNTAKEKGGGYHNEHSETGLTRFTNLTITGNAAPVGAGIYNGEDDNVTIINTIVAANAGGADCAGKAVDLLGANIDSDGTCAAGPGTDPLLGPLADNGGFTDTHALTGGSPAIDAGDDGLCPAIDQRGVERPQGTHCDIGAYEAAGDTTPSPSQSPTATPTPTASPGGQARIWGDNNCSQQVDPVDSLFVLRGDAGLSTNTGDCPDMGEDIEVLNASPHIWGDVDCGGAMTPVDSLKLLRFDAGLSVTREVGCPLIGAEVTVVE